jgi:Uma2 family endonuclease
MATQSKPGENGFNYGDYLLWPEEERWELIDGVPYNMTPAPSRRHQEILAALTASFYRFLEEQECRVYMAPFDVRLPEGKEREDKIRTVVQPDLVVVCDPGKLDDKGCIGAPDLVLEITSPSTARKDLKEKLALYERQGVREYWIVHPTDETVMVFRLNARSRYERPDISIVLEKIFKK